MGLPCRQGTNEGTDLVGNHVYVIREYHDQGTDDPSDDVILLFNPHGIDGNETEQQMAKIFPKITIAQLKDYVKAIRVPEQPNGEP